MFRWRRLPSLTHRLYVRMYLALLLALALTALLFGTAWHLNPENAQIGGSLETFAEIAEEVLPPADAPAHQQEAALRRWQPRTHADLALYSAAGNLLAVAGQPLPPLDPTQTTSGWLGGHPPVFALKLPDGRWLLGEHVHPRGHRPRPGLAAALALIALAVGLVALPLVRRLTRRLERLQRSVEALGSGQLSTRVAVEGDDEVARLAASFNRSAAHIEALVEAQRNLLANASHELRSPLARIRMAVELLPPDAAPQLHAELAQNIRELDSLIDEILLASRLDSPASPPLQREAVDLTVIAAEEAARVGASLREPTVDGGTIVMQGDARLLRRLLRNLLENAQRHAAGGSIEVSLHQSSDTLEIQVSDHGPGVPEAERDAIFEPFYRLPGSRERDGGSGLGLSLVRQIARHHGGTARCEARAGGGSCFVVRLQSSDGRRS